ncbi:hypothetical protein C6P46_001738 [Rhodotorula mucilaginosa]|uniref:Carboxylesterase type B domain-containing protein n=1 Tax=Rhodotorula mucilaginosa TaxID=5537 RepID=A0A9P7B7J2_RHOMI|nr:hypothetical protein C6P46_001738 [Rhodotorula mucilaginosa]
MRVSTILRPIATLVQSAQSSPTSPASSPATRRLPQRHVLGDDGDDDDHDDEGHDGEGGNGDRLRNGPQDKARRAPGSANSNDETIPLTAFRDSAGDDNDDDDQDDEDADSLPVPAAASRTNRRRKSASSAAANVLGLLDRLPTRRVLVILIVIVGLYKASHYAGVKPDYGVVRSKLEEYSARYNPWHPGGHRNGILWVDVAPLAHIKGTKYRAHQEDEEDRFWAWKAVPYAEPPTGARRFRVAEPIKDRSKRAGTVRERVMDTWDEGCIRPKPREDRSDGPHEEFLGHEDCLKVNVFSPMQRPNATLLPVMVWIHGGGFVSGTSSEENYHPRELLDRAIDLEQPFVFTSFNYRLGALGLSASPPEPGAPPTAPHIPTRPASELDLNVAFKDQLMALEWIRDHIAQFGGDPDKIVLVGHSAGAMSVGLHQLYSGDRGLFRGAFMLSGAPTSFPVPWPHDAAARTVHPLPGPAQCPSPVQREHGPPQNVDLLECLRGLPIERLYEATRVLTDDSPANAWFPYYPVLEGEWEPEKEGGARPWLDVRPSERITRGNYAKIPVVMGSVDDEGTRFIRPDIAEGENEFLEVVKDIFDFTYGAVEELLEPILAYYPPDPKVGSPFFTGPETFGLSSNYKRLSSFVGDVLFQAPRRHFLRETPKDFGEDSWNYLYREPRAGAQARMGIQHGADLPAWFGHPDETDEPMLELSWDMTGYLINFVHKLDPNGPGLPRWPKFGMDRLTLQFQRDNTTVIEDSDRLEAMRFLNVNNPIFAR